MGLVYDLFRIIRRVRKCNLVVTAFMDLAFWGFTAWRTFEIMHTYSNGTLRWFAILGTVVLLGIYMKFFSRYVVSFGVFLLTPVRTFIIWCKKYLTKFLKLSIIKLRDFRRKGDKHGKKRSISDEISQ